MLRKIFGRKEPEPIVEKQEAAREEPTGRILNVQDNVRGQLVALMGKLKRDDYTIDELRKAARCPLVADIVNTIMREVLSYALEVKEKDPADDDRPKVMLEKTLRNPNDMDRTFRISTSGMMRDWLVIGRCYVELLRAKRGQAARVATAYKRGEIGPDEFSKQVVGAAKEPGPILGWIAHDPDNIRANVTSRGVWKDPAFYDVTSLGPFAQSVPISRLATAPSFDLTKMVMIQYTGTTETETRLTPPSPTSEAYPLIDILYAMLVLLRNKLDKPQMDKLVSFIVPESAQQITSAQMDTLVTSMREDLAQGTLPVLPYVQALVSEIGMGDSFTALWTILSEIQVIAWGIFGAGGVQMLRMEGQGRQAAGQQMEAARKQAVGNMLRIIADDFVRTTIIEDKYSPYGGLAVTWVDRSETPSRATELEREYMLLMDQGLPLWVVLKENYPELVAQLEAAEIDPKSLYPPQLAAAWLKMKGEFPTEGMEGVKGFVEMLSGMRTE